MPSVYLEQGGRLRCQAVARLLAGLRRHAVVAPASSAARSAPARPPRSSRHRRAPRVRRVGPVGRRRALRAADASASAPSASSTPTRRRGPTRACAGRSSAAPTCWPAAIEQLGGPEGTVLPAQRAGPRRRPHVGARGPRGHRARDRRARRSTLAGFESAMVALDDGHGSLYVHHAEGPFAVVFNDLDAAELDAIAHWVDLGTSSYTVAEAAGRGFAGHETLRRAGRRLAGRPAADRRGPAPRRARARRPRAAPAARPTTSSCSSCSPSRPPAGCAWPPPCSSCASAPRATR